MGVQARRKLGGGEVKQEANLKAALMRALRDVLPDFVHQRHEDRFSSGWPDISVSGYGRTSFWEVKHADPRFSSNGLQELTCLRLALASFHCRYIVYHENHGIKRTLIVHPNHIGDLLPEFSCAGFNHTWLVEQIRKVHGIR